MFYIFFFLFIFSIVFCKNQEQQIIHIRVDEELPISTILFTTTNTATYRLFDTGRNQNSFVRYDSSNGHLLLARSIDREDLCSQRICSCIQCQLTIELIEWQTPYRLLQLILNIDDINDHEPRFSSKYYEFNLMENIPIGYELSLEQAIDADLGENSRINYELKRLDKKNNDGPFELVTKINGGIILKVIKEIDREERDHYEYELIAFDNGQPQRQSSTKLSIKIDDMNDNPVVLLETHIRLNVSENTPIGTELTRVNATDQDIGLNGKIHYSISNGLPSSSWMDYFRINDSTGMLTLVSRLDYESEQSYRLTIQVRDLGENSLSRFATIDIYVLDENDNQPQAFITFVESLINETIIPLHENTPIGQMLAHVSISDQDSGLNGEMSYRIEQGNDLIGIRPIDQKSFLLVTQNSIDREDQKLHSDKFILIIYDHGQPSKSLRLEYKILIIDENDSPPIFNQSLNCNIQLNPSDNQSMDNNQSLFHVYATDSDIGDNGLLSYSILPPYDNFFTINDQGQVFNIENLNQSSYYHIRIMAIDHGKPKRLNSTHDCFISTSIMHIFDNYFDYENISFSNLTLINNNQNLFQWSLSLFDQYSYVVIGLFLLFLFIIIIIITILITFCLHTFIFRHRKILKPKKKTYNCSRQFNFYDTLQRKSPFIHDDSGCSSKIDEHDDITSEERERLVNLNGSDRTSFESSDSMNKQIRILNKTSTMRPLSDHHSFSRISRNSYPPSPFLSSMPSVVIPPPKPPRDSGFESICLLKQHQQQIIPGRPLSLSISTATTYTSSGTDSSSSPLPPPMMNTFRAPYSSFRYNAPISHVARLAEEEKMDV
ncbi:unnamed protein product [Adineta steineri]|uniref:Cadherin domain-containing protein n=1 Tax=Adineta steineri TaxID=433720 RepID=A0A816ACX4_9BILA|nr:unnamed protein product [Adineta steineri]CAF1595816.1 unnamed protein product [Adineta steineri]